MNRFKPTSGSDSFKSCKSQVDENGTSTVVSKKLNQSDRARESY